MLTKQFGWSKADKNYRAVSYYDYSRKRQRILETALAMPPSPMARLWTVKKLLGRGP
ncbi:hypothetical protein ACNKHK_09255 [Shigella flexneri]